MKMQHFFRPIDLTTGAPWKVILRFSIPVFISNIFQQVYSMVDAIIIGHYIPLQFAGVSDTGSLVFIIIQFAFGCTAGFSVITGRNYGRRDYSSFRKSFASTITLAFIISIALTIIALIFTKPLLSWINVSPENDIITYNAAKTYLSIIYAGLATMIFYNLIVSILRSIGDSTTPLLFLILSSLLNIGLDFLFISQFRTPDAKVAGAALATVISQAVSAILCFIYTFRKYHSLRPQREDFNYFSTNSGELLRQGLPLAFQFSILAIGLITLQGAINTFDIGKTIPGTTTPAHYAQDGYGAAVKLDNFLVAPYGAIGAATLSFTAQNYGAGNLKRIRQGFNQSFLIIAGAYLVINLLGWLLTIDGFFLHIFIADSNIYTETIYYATAYIHVALPSSIFLGVLFMGRSSVQGMGKPLYPFLAGIAELLARILICIYIPSLINAADPVSNASFIGICFADPLAWFAGMAVLLYGVIRFIYRAKEIPTTNKIVNENCH